MDRLRAMESFVQVVRSGSFAEAARQLGLSRAMVSRHVQDLEDHLRVRLLNRSTRALHLTDAGSKHYDFCRSLLDQIEERERELAHDRLAPRGSLKIVASKSFGSLHLSDAIIAFAHRYPDIRATLILDDFSFRAYDFVDSGLDVAIRLTPIADVAIVTRKLITLHWLLCAAPDYLDRHGAPDDPRDLGDHQCLTHINLDLNDRLWQLEGTDGPASLKVEPRFLSNSALVLRKAALAGLGIGLLPRYCIEDDLRDGRLVPVLPAFRPPERTLYAAFPHRRLTPQPVRLFIDFLVEWFRTAALT